MPNKLDLLNKKFGKLTVVSEAGKSSHGKITWNCKCDCGREIKDVISGNLVQLRTTSCGICYRTYDLTGEKFGDLTVEGFSHKDQTSEVRGRLIWNCVDGQGRRTKASTSELVNGIKTKVHVLEDLKSVVARDVYAKYKSSAKTRTYKFELSLSEFTNYLYKNCHYCNAEPANTLKSGRKDGSVVHYNGVDRVNNKKGYNVDNCVTCCRTCNRAKYFLGVKDWLKYLKQVHDNYETLKKTFNDKLYEE